METIETEKSYTTSPLLTLVRLRCVKQVLEKHDRTATYLADKPQKTILSMVTKQEVAFPIPVWDVTSAIIEDGKDPQKVGIGVVLGKAYELFFNETYESRGSKSKSEAIEKPKEPRKVATTSDAPEVDLNSELPVSPVVACFSLLAAINVLASRDERCTKLAETATRLSRELLPQAQEESKENPRVVLFVLLISAIEIMSVQSTDKYPEAVDHTQQLTKLAIEVQQLMQEKAGS